MSYDIGLYYKTKGDDIEIRDFGNYTYNVSPMYRKAFGEGSTGINELSGLSPDYAIHKLSYAILYFRNNREELEKLNPVNGWGNYEGALQFLNDIRDGLVPFVDSKEMYVGVC